MRVLATAGHVDHGKSTLVRALTGMEPDRFAEEKARGLTIDLGFAWMTLPSGGEVGFVDVPGHVRFLKNMLAGAGGVDACIFVVAATEGWKPQSEEHLRILELLGIEHGFVALTKVGLVDDDTRDIVAMGVADRVYGTFLGNAEIVAVDAVSGHGTGDVVNAIERLVASTPTAVDVDRPRLWVDRSFSARGSGTVVTGTLAGGSLAVDDELTLLPAGRTARVRGLQTHGSRLDAAAPGRRLAVNLAGLSHGDVQRGDALVRAGQWAPSRRVDASLTVLASLDHEVSRRGAYQAYIGSGEHAVALRVLGAGALAPGTAGPVRLHLPVALPLTPGDRFVLRESGRSETVGGGEILDVNPVRPASRAQPSRSVDRVVAERGWIDVDDLYRLTGVRRAPDIGRWAASAEALEAMRRRVAEAVDAAGPLGLDTASLDERERAILATIDGIDTSAGHARRGRAEDALANHPFVAALEASPFAPPSPKECGIDGRELRALVQRRLVVERDGMYFAPAAVDAAAQHIAQLLVDTPDGVTVSTIRETLGTSRKFLLPLLNHLDATGVTRRRGDLRIAGPRLPSAR